MGPDHRVCGPLKIPTEGYPRLKQAQALALFPTGPRPQAVKAVTDKSLPLLDSGPLVLLADQAGEKAARGFLSDYLHMLPARTARIADVLAKRDFNGGMDAVLSLKVTSSMTGAVRLEHYCGQLEQLLTLGHLPEAESVRTELSGVASLLLREGHRDQTAAGMN